jgi:type I restriction enzyme R subunit
MARYTKSVVLYRQMRGRGTRKAPGKQRFTLFDFVGITDLHDSDETMPEGGLVRDQRKGEVYEPRTLLTLGINDSIDANTREWITIDENGNFVFLDANLQQQILFSERFEAWLAERDDLHGEEQRLLLSIGAALKANAGQGEPFTVDHFRVPPFANSGGLARALQTFGSEERLRAVLESLNRAVFDEADPGREETTHKHL